MEQVYGTNSELKSGLVLIQKPSLNDVIQEV